MWEYNSPYVAWLLLLLKEQHYLVVNCALRLPFSIIKVTNLLFFYFVKCHKQNFQKLFCSLSPILYVNCLKKDPNFVGQSRCLKITEKVSFNIASEARYVYILRGQKLSKNAKNGLIWRVFENL